MGRGGAAAPRHRSFPGFEFHAGDRVSRGGRVVARQHLERRGRGGDRERDAKARETAVDVVRAGARDPVVEPRRRGRRGARDDFGGGGGGDAMNKAPINVQDSFFYNLRKDNVPVTVRLTSGEERRGWLRRFDKV